MNVIAGKYKGRVLKTVSDLSVRPATSKVRAAIFNILQSRIEWSSSSILDLYAGSGSVGIEALSRGAKKAVFIEFDRIALQFLKQNITHIGAENDSQILFSDVKSYLGSSPKGFDVVFCDPPYAIDYLAQLPTMVFESGVVNKNGILVFEHPTRFEFSPSSLWKPVVERSYGRTSITMFQHNTELL
jgi:16S rRNA (guanine966-N2)-methyltransferase